jgi:hypothetical protein
VDVKMATREEAYEYWGRVICRLGDMSREMQSTWRFDELRVSKVPVTMQGRRGGGGLMADGRDPFCCYIASRSMCTAPRPSTRASSRDRYSTYAGYTHYNTI